ncbi:MAG: hypothetical protein A2W99_14195 [Bacteroidetes bacterium GWF2_33_16]|nr:MAG: hypothetical protein A2X00_06125 [Bacteroidetes bacterium GWE2_32_14]OFY04777.1 MAG: hypothetical protein A2W99_14195 [Bacteroidetes bacterium GWF2_33_16]
MITKEKFDSLRTELSIKSKNGIDFTFSASIVWLVISLIWMLNIKAYDKSILTFMVGGVMLPLALLLSKLLKTTWTNKENPLQPFGLWLNFAQLFYFPFLIFALIKMPEYFVMVYVIITGAHFFPYAWFYKTKLYAIFAGLISVGALVLGLILSAQKMHLIPLFMSALLLILSILLYFDSRKKWGRHYLTQNN